MALFCTACRLSCWLSFQLLEREVNDGTNNWSFTPQTVKFFLTTTFKQQVWQINLHKCFPFQMSGSCNQDHANAYEYGFSYGNVTALKLFIQLKAGKKELNSCQINKKRLFSFSLAIYFHYFHAPNFSSFKHKIVILKFPSLGWNRI